MDEIESSVEKIMHNLEVNGWLDLAAEVDKDELKDDIKLILTEEFGEGTVV